MSKKTVPTRFASVAALIVMLQSCPVFSLPPAQAADAKVPIKIGFVTCLSGAAAQPGGDMVNGIKLYMDQVKNKMAGRNVTLLVENDASNPATAVEKINKLVNGDKIDILDGTLLVNICYAAAAAADRLQIPFVGAVATADDLTQRRRSKWMVRVGYTSSQPAHPFGEYVYKKLGYKKVVTFAMDYPFGWEVVGGFQKGFEQAGGQVIQKIWPPLGFRDFSEYIKSMRKDADAVFLCNVGNAAILVPKQYKQFGPGLPVIGMGTSSDESTLADEGDDALGYVTTLIYSAALQTPANKAFADAYRAKYHKDPSYYAECGYTSGLWINKALDALKGDVSDKEKVLAALKNVELKDAPRGPIKLDAYNSPIENVYVRKVEKVNGKLQNTVIQTFPNVSQFWKWKPEDYLKEPLYSRENPPCKFCTTK